MLGITSGSLVGFLLTPGTGIPFGYAKGLFLVFCSGITHGFVPGFVLRHSWLWADDYSCFCAQGSLLKVLRGLFVVLGIEGGSAASPR